MPSKAAPATRVQAAPAMQVVTSQRLAPRSSLANGLSESVSSSSMWTGRRAHPRDRRESTGQFPYAIDQKPVPLNSHRRRHPASSRLFPIRREALNALILSTSLAIPEDQPRECRKSAFRAHPSHQPTAGDVRSNANSCNRNVNLNSRSQITLATDCFRSLNHRKSDNGKTGLEKWQE